MIHPKADVHSNAKIAETANIHAYTYIEGDVEIEAGSNIKPFCYICDGVRIGKRVFISAGTIFCNDRYPRVQVKGERKWDSPLPVTVEDDVSIGSGAIILPGVTIGRHARVAAGAVVTRNTPPHVLVAGNPARIIGVVRIDSRKKGVYISRDVAKLIRVQSNFYDDHDAKGYRSLVKRNLVLERRENPIIGPLKKPD